MSESVIVAHGLWMPGLETALLRNRLKAAGFEPFLFRFPAVRVSLAQNVQRLAAFAAGIRGDKRHFVGHSLGGVVTLTMLSQTQLANVGRIVCLGSPLTGTRTGAFLAQSRVGRLLVGKSLLEHMACGGLGRWEPKYDLGIIAGTRSLGFGRFVQDLPAENDGTVAVDETRLPGATAHLTLPVTHTQLLIDRTVARQSIHFLRHGRFAD